MCNGQTHQNHRLLMLIKVDTPLSSKTDVDAKMM